MASLSDNCANSVIPHSRARRGPSSQPRIYAVNIRAQLLGPPIESPLADNEANLDKECILLALSDVRSIHHGNNFFFRSTKIIRYPAIENSRYVECQLTAPGAQLTEPYKLFG